MFHSMRKKGGKGTERDLSVWYYADKSLEELMEMLCKKTAAGSAMFTDEDAREHLTEFDKNGDGQWQVDEFIDFMLGFFRVDDAVAD